MPRVIAAVLQGRPIDRLWPALIWLSAVRARAAVTLSAATKRSIDVTVAGVALLLALPVLLAAALAIRINGGPGPILFRQRRAGRNGAPFVMYKLRTMHDGADDDKELFRRFNELPSGPCFKMRHDPRITPVGRWLRRSSLDELPQLWNVLRGEMSLVGPRPLPLDEVRRDTGDERARLMVLPGMTGLWQVSGRVEIPYPRWAAMDAWYARNRSLGLDVLLLVKTVPAVLSGRGAY